MAEAIARHLAADVIEPASAGLIPLGHIAGPTTEVLAEKGISAAGQHSKALPNLHGYDGLIINMTGIPGRSLFPSAQVTDWPVEDPYAEKIDTYRRVRDRIEQLVSELAADLRAKQSPEL